MKRFSWQANTLIAITTFLFVLGVLMVFNASSADAIDRKLFEKSHYALIRQLLNFVVGLFICFAFWKVGYKELIRFSPQLMILLCIALVLVFIPGVGRCVNGARRWIVLGSFVGQPSEFVKIVMPLFFVHKISDSQYDSKSLLKIFAFISLPIFLVLIEPSNGITAILVATFIALMFLSRLSYKWWLLPIIAFGCMGALAATKIPYVQARIQSYLHPEKDLLGKGHQPFQSKIATGSGGLLGKGLAHSMQKMSYLPEAQNDYIAAIFAEEFGYLGMLTLILCYMSLAYLGFSMALKAQTKQGAILSASLIFSLSLQAFLNLAVVSGLLPSTGLNLPFFSQGGSSLLANMLAITLIMNVQRSELVKWA